MSNRNGVWSLPAQYQAIADQDWTMAPGAPTGVSATAGNAQAEVSFTAPTFAGIPGTITQFKVTSSSGQTATGSASPITVTGLTNGSGVTFTAQAQNAIGLGKASAASSSITPLAEVISGLFQTTLWDGDGSSSRTITNGVNLSGKGGLAWIKSRDQGLVNGLFDTARGKGSSFAYRLMSDATDAQSELTDGLSSFNTNGFTLGSSTLVNGNNYEYVGWTFRKEPKFFDIVTYTGNGSARTISHNLGSVPGMIIIKRLNAVGGWSVYHRGVNGGTNPEQYSLELNETSAQSDDQWMQDTAPTSTQFSINTFDSVNNNGSTYVAYLFAHNNNDGGFGPDSDDIIKCGTYTNSGSGVEVNLGFEPQFMMFKRTDATSNWGVVDVMRGVSPVSSAGDNSNQLRWNLSDAENAEYHPFPTATGFKVVGSAGGGGGGSGTFIYMAIRRPDQSTPTAGTSVFQAHTYTGDGSTRLQSLNITPDMVINLSRNVSGDSPSINDRVRGSGKEMYTSGTGGQSSYPSQGLQLDHTNAIEVQDYRDTNTKNYLNLCWKRANGYFDIVAYSGNGSTQNVTHNLGAAPEMMWIKRYDTTGSWMVYHKGLNGGTNPEQYVFYLHDPQGPDQSTQVWNSTAPTSSVFSVGNNNAVNNSSGEYVAYLFATVAGVSKVGSYTSTIDGSGNGTNQTIDCGFTNGARFVFIKRSDGAGDWVIFDSTRGITTNSDPHYRLNQVYTEDSDAYVDIEPHSSGFIVNPGSVHVGGDTQGQTYVFYAIA